MGTGFKIFYVFVGAVGAALYTADSPSASVVVKKMFPGGGDHIYARVDFLLSIIFSTLLATYIYDPGDQGKCVIAGLSGVALLKQALMKWTQPPKKKASQ